MKKKMMLLAFGFAMTGQMAHATDYGYLTFQQSDGSLTTLVAEGLKITFADGKLIAQQGTQTKTLDLTSLSNMYFTNDGSTSITSIQGNIPAITVQNGQIWIATKESGKAELYRLDGIQLGSQNIEGGKKVSLATGLTKGIYIVSINGVRTKISVR